MLVKATRRDQFLPYVGRLGISLPYNVEVEIPDDTYKIPAFVALVNAEEVAVLAYGASETDNVSQPEFNAVASGLFKASVGVGGTGIIVTSPLVHASLTTLQNTGFLFTAFNNVLKIKVDSLYTIQMTFDTRYYTIAEMVTFLNNYAPFMNHCVAAADGIYLKISAKSYGLNSKIEILSSAPIDANSVMKFPLVSDPVTIATCETITITCKGPTGNPAANAKVEMVVYDAATAGSLLVTCKFQRLSTGTTNQTLYRENLTAWADAKGKIVVELMNSVADDLYLQLNKDADYEWAVMPSSRTHIIAVAAV